MLRGVGRPVSDGRLYQILRFWKPRPCGIHGHKFLGCVRVGSVPCARLETSEISIPNETSIGKTLGEAIRHTKCRQSYCHMSKTIASGVGLPNKWFQEQGMLSLKNLWRPRMTFQFKHSYSDSWVHRRGYPAIPIVLIYFVRQRKDIPFTPLFWLFASFILACGTVHLVEAIIFWHPIYRVSGLVKLLTAVVSWATVLALIRLAPSILNLPSLATTNRLLNQEVNQRRQTERDERALKARYEALLSGTRSIVWTTDPHGSFITPQHSWQRYTGQTWEQHQGNGWLTKIHEDDREELLSSWNDSLRRKSRYTLRGRIWHEDSGSYRWFNAEAVPVTHTKRLSHRILQPRGRRLHRCLRCHQ